MFMLAGFCIILAAVAAYWAKKQYAHQRSENGRLLYMMCGALALLLLVGGFLKWGQA